MGGIIESRTLKDESARKNGIWTSNEPKNTDQEQTLTILRDQEQNMEEFVSSGRLTSATATREWKPGLTNYTPK